MSKRKTRRPHGQIRRSQIITTFGPGSMLDLPNHSVLVGGLDHWRGVDPAHEVDEPRLLYKLRTLLGIAELKLYAPPPDHGDPTLPSTGIEVWQFPEWFITQDVQLEAKGGGSVRSRLLVHRNSLTRGKFIDRDRKRQHVVPIRFVRACVAGHIGDIDWYSFVHPDPDKSDCKRQLWIDEMGTSGDIAEIRIRCECGLRRPLAEAISFGVGALGHCDGGRPWLGPYSGEKCKHPNRLLIRTASNAYFAEKMSVISLPGRDETVSKAVDNVWPFLEEVDSVDDVRYERKKARVKTVLEGIRDDEIWSEIQARRGEGDQQTKSVKQAELETLVAAKDELGNDKPDGDFFARTLPREKWDRPWMADIHRVVLVHRLREVVAQVGFTRFEATAPDTEGELDMGVQRAALAQEMSWVPAIENRGEGIFIQFDTDAVNKWRDSKLVSDYGESLLRGFEVWQAEHKSSNREFPGLPYVLLHSFAHLLITSISLECGYPASSIRERIYALSEVGYGILLYTGSPDAEGTLGGLIEVGRRIQDHVKAALDYAGLCSNDPVCAGHQPENPHERRFLHGAACHGCVLIAETSCEMYNDYLDRTLVVPTLERRGTEFFKTDDA
ncbi:DrmB family protein [Planctomycetota bacterium]